jgi:hypothetical protein
VTFRRIATGDPSLTLDSFRDLSASSFGRFCQGTLNSYTRRSAAAAWLLNEFHIICESHGDPLEVDVANRAVSVGWDFLNLYCSLRRTCFELGDPGYHIVQKFHYFAHLLLDIEATRLNPWYHHCFLDEDMVGRVGRGSRKVHRQTLSERWLGRYIHMFFLRWAKAD